MLCTAILLGLAGYGGYVAITGKINNKPLTQTLGGPTVAYPQQGGTGTSTKPTAGQMLIGNSGGLYDLIASSSLGGVLAGSNLYFNPAGTLNVTSTPSFTSVKVSTGTYNNNTYGFIGDSQSGMHMNAIGQLAIDGGFAELLLESGIFKPGTGNQVDLGSEGTAWKNVNASGTVFFSGNTKLFNTTSTNLNSTNISATNVTSTNVSSTNSYSNSYTGFWNGSFNGFPYLTSALATSTFMQIAASTTYNFDAPTITVASTSLAIGSTTTIPLGFAIQLETWSSYMCWTDTATATVQFGTYNGTYMKAVNASSTGTLVLPVTMSANNTFAAGVKKAVQIGQIVNMPNYVTCTAKKQF